MQKMKTKVNTGPVDINVDTGDVPLPLATFTEDGDNGDGDNGDGDNGDDNGDNDNEDGYMEGLDVDVPMDDELNNLEITAVELLQAIESGIPVASSLRIGDWCVVRYETVCYPGVVEDIINNEVKCGPAKWKWPDPIDCLWYKQEDMMKKIDPPTPVASRGHFQFIDIIGNEA